MINGSIKAESKAPRWLGMLNEEAVLCLYKPFAERAPAISRVLRLVARIGLRRVSTVRANALVGPHHARQSTFTRVVSASGIVHTCPHPLYHCPHCSEAIRSRMRQAFARAFWQAVAVGSFVMALAYFGILRVLFGGSW